MQGYSPKLPLTYDPTEDGLYSLNKTILESIKQNFKMLLLTNPGERIMEPEFGVGLKQLLFEQDVQNVRDILQNKIVSQTRKYLNFIALEQINISPPEQNEENIIFINIVYSVPLLKTRDELSLNI